MKPITHKSYLAHGFAGALIITLILFGSLPNLVSIKPEKNDLESLNPVDFIRFTPEPPKPREKPQKQEPDKKPEKIIKPRTQKPREMVQQQLTLDIPAMDLDIDPRISGGIPVISRPPAPKVAAVMSQPDFSSIMDQSEVDIMPMPTFKRSPRYPFRAKRMGIEGVVKIQFLVDKYGNVSNITILEANPPEFFERSVLNAVSTWKFSPGELMGRKVATMVTTSIVFKLEE